MNMQAAVFRKGTRAVDNRVSRVRQAVAARGARVHDGPAGPDTPIAEMRITTVETIVVNMPMVIEGPVIPQQGGIPAKPNRKKMVPVNAILWSYIILSLAAACAVGSAGAQDPDAQKKLDSMRTLASLEAM